MTDRNGTQSDTQCDRSSLATATDASLLHSDSPDAHMDRPTDKSSHPANDHKRKRRGEEDVRDVNSKRLKGDERCFPRNGMSDQQRREEQFPDDDRSKDQESYKIGKVRVTRQALKDMIIKALDAGSLLGLHPAAHAKEDTIVIRSAGLQFFEALRSLRDEGARHLRLDLLQHTNRTHELSRQRGLLSITMPGPLHEMFGSVTNDIRQQMLEQNFLPRPFAEDAIMVTGSTTMELSYDPYAYFKP